MVVGFATQDKFILLKKVTKNDFFSKYKKRIVAGNWSTWRKPPTYCKSLTNLITKCCIDNTS
jgi:hypothetical protein